MLKPTSILLLLALILPPFPVLAQHLEPTLSDPAAEARARTISKELRCLVCQNQSIEESNAPLARDLRQIVRERIAAGDSDAAVLEFLVARYGEWVLLTPRFNTRTFLLWVGPAVLLALGGLVVLALHRRQRRALQHARIVPLSDDEQQRLTRLLRDDDGRGAA